MLTDAGKKSLRREMEALLGPGSVLSDPDELLVYESDGLTLFRALADFVVFLCSARASYSVGSAYFIDGGMLKTI